MPTTHTTNKTGTVFSEVRAVTFAIQCPIYAANITERLCFLLWSVPTGYKGYRRSFESVELEAPACQVMRLGAKESN
jgi:hypothetical protein